MRYSAYLLLLLIIESFCISAQVVKQINYPIQPLEATSASLNGTKRIHATNYQLYTINVPALASELNGITYREGQLNGFIGKMSFPHPDGSFHEYTVKRNKTLHPKLNEQFPEIMTLDCYATDGSGAYGKWDITPQGFHAMIFIPGQSTVFIDPYIVGNSTIYIAYHKKDFTTTKKRDCDVVESKSNFDQLDYTEKLSFGTCDLRTYRLAVAATGEYTTFHGGTVALAQAAQATTMNRVNGVYEKDIAITMVIVPNNNSIVYTSTGADPYTNGTPGTMINQNQTNCDNVIGSANYDIGHVFGTNSGGLAGLGVVCTGGQKARGVTGSSAPIGDPFDIDYVAHEMGHQFGGNHTQNNNCNSVSAARREPGSASTIMGYAGICAPNVQNNSDDYFHGYNLGEISTEILSNGHQCEVLTPLNNTPPTISTTNGGFSVPISTPFILTGTATDPDGDILTYLWEQMDNEQSTQPPVATATGGPNFRSFDPSTNPSRYFPNLASLASNGPYTWEVLPSVSRVMDFRLTVRDNHAVGSCNAYTDVTVTTVAAAGPFVVTYPTNTGITWGSGSTQTVTWNVANTTASPINCANVSIRLSLDGGVTYPIVLVASTPNDGSQSVLVPNASTTTARIMIMSQAETFFDISNNNFAITCTSPVLPTFNTSATYCQNEAVSPLPTTSTNNITGTWNTQLSTANLGSTTYTFTPTSGLCASQTNLTVTVNPSVTPTFTSLAPLCLNQTPPVLPSTSNNGILGVWNTPISTAIPGNNTYTFTPNAGQCAAVTNMTVSVQDVINPTFNTYGPYCQNDVAAILPTTSVNGINGTWSSQINTSIIGGTGYTFTPSSGQCASTAVLTVTVISPPSNQITQNGLTLTSSANNATYQWIDCNNQNSAIPGAVNQSFAPGTISGSYAVIVSNGTCSITTDCFLFDQSALTELDDNSVLVYPNPFNAEISISWTGNTPNQLTVYDAMGKLVLSIIPKEGTSNISIPTLWSEGVYLLQLESDGYIVTKRLIKQ
jgi:hypothetical protein